MTQTLRTLSTLRAARQKEAEQELRACQAECARRSELQRDTRAAQRALEAELRAKAEAFAASSALLDLVWCERELEALRHAVTQASARSAEAERHLSQAERALQEAERGLREALVEARAVGELLERGEREAERRAELREEEEASDTHLSGRRG